MFPKLELAPLFVVVRAIGPESTIFISEDVIAIMKPMLLVSRLRGRIFAVIIRSPWYCVGEREVEEEGGIYTRYKVQVSSNLASGEATCMKFRFCHSIPRARDKRSGDIRSYVPPSPRHRNRRHHDFCSAIQRDALAHRYRPVQAADMPAVKGAAVRVQRRSRRHRDCHRGGEDAVAPGGDTASKQKVKARPGVVGVLRPGLISFVQALQGDIISVLLLSAMRSPPRHVGGPSCA